MAGHSKWNNIKRRKGAQDAKKAKIFSKISKEISVAVKEGGPDPESNTRLRMALQNAKGVNMPKDNVERAIKKASSDDSKLEPITLEGYSPGGVAIFVECLTDNNNRTVSSIRAIFNKYGGNLGKNGSIAFLFDQKGVFTIPKKDDMDLETLELELIDAGAEDIEVEDEILTVYTAKEDFGNVQKMVDAFEEDDDVQNVYHNLELTEELQNELAN